MDDLKDKIRGAQAEETIFLVYEGEKAPREARISKNTKKSS